MFTLAADYERLFIPATAAVDMTDSLSCPTASR
jgi:hypothetical protein